MSNIKRTRSQLTLPDFDYHKLARSPLKDARTALRNHNSASPSSDLAVPNGPVNSLDIPCRTAKRLSSPRRDITNVERDSKRARHEMRGDDFPSHVQKSESAPSVHNRSRSVPLFPSIPLIDFSQVPRSPSKSVVSLDITSLNRTQVQPSESEKPMLSPQNTQPRILDGYVHPKTPLQEHASLSLLALSPLTPLEVSPCRPVRQADALSRHDHNHFTSNVEADAPIGQHRNLTPCSRIPRLPPTVPSRAMKDMYTGHSSLKRRHGPQQQSSAAVLSSRRVTRSVSLRQQEMKRSEGSSGTVYPAATASPPLQAPSRALRHAASHTILKQSTLFSFTRPTVSSTAKANTHPAQKTCSSIPVPTGPKQGPQDNLALSSSLSSLSDALQRLSTPLLPRSNTSIDFSGQSVAHHQPSELGDDGRSRHIQTDLGGVSAENNRFSVPTRRADTKGKLMEIPVNSRESRLMLPPPIHSGTGAQNRNNAQPGLVIRKDGDKRYVSGTVRVSASGPASSRPSLFRFGSSSKGSAPNAGRVFHRASKPTSLPSVQGSPVKAGWQSFTPALDTAETTSTNHCTKERRVSAANAPIANDQVASPDVQISEPSMPTTQPAKKCDPSRRASLASYLLSHSLSSFPHPTDALAASQDGPPTALARGKEITSALPGSRTNSSSSDHAEPAFAARVSLRKSNSNLAEQNQKAEAPISLEALKDCTIFVDVRTDDGDDASALFIDMLQGLGAKTLMRVGQTCTHIVYKNGLVSTLTRYRLLKEPRPFVVGIAWVVECAEQKNHVDETKFMVSLDEENIAGLNKRRRSMLPKQLQATPSTSISPVAPALISSAAKNAEMGSVHTTPTSIDGASPMTTIDDSQDNNGATGDIVLPLEKARRRRSALLGL